MTQQRIETSSVVDLRDEVILTANAHSSGVTFTSSAVNTLSGEISIASHGLQNDQQVYFYSSDTLPSGVTAYAAYYVVAATVSTFKISTSMGGSPVIPSSGGLGTHTVAGQFSVEQSDPWDDVLKALSNFALDAATEVPALAASASPGPANPYLTRAHLEMLLDGNKAFVLVGPPGSYADFEGTDETPFNAAVSFLQARSASTDGGWIVVLPGIYVFSSTLSLPDGINLEGLHPNSVVFSNNGNHTPLELAGSQVCVSKITVESPSSTTTVALKVSGQKSRVEHCRVVNFGYGGVLVSGLRNTLKLCLIDRSAAVSYPGLVLANKQNNVEHCSFKGTLSGGAVRIEGSECGVFGCYFSSSLTGYSFKVLSSSANDNRLVANYFGSAGSLALSEDNGTDTIRYGNMPNTGVTNENNFLEPLKTFTGQPTLTSSSAVLSNSFTHDLSSTSLTDILDHTVAGTASIDLLVQRSYEERNFFLRSGDPTFDGQGAPTGGVFSWDGTTLSFPQFYIRSVFARGAEWVINSGTANLSAGDVLVVDIDQSLSGIDITLTPQVMSVSLALADPADADRLVLAFGLGANTAVWMSGFRLLTALTSFDVDGTPLPLVRFVGVTESRNPAAPFSGFSGAAQSNLTEKLSAQAAHLRLLYEKTNVGLQPLTADAEISTDPIPGNWEDMTSGIPAAPTHVLQLKGTAYGLDPTVGLYRFNRDIGSWSLVGGNPGSAPFAAMSRLQTGLALLQSNGTVIFYDPDAVGGVSWLSYTPTLSPKVLSLMPLVSSRPASFMTGGQADYAVQTENHTYFTTLEGYTVRFSLDNNTLEYCPRVFTEGALESGFFSHSLKDTGYNSLRDAQSLFETCDNGLSYTTYLPAGQGQFLAFSDSCYDEFKATDFSKLVVENFSHDPHSGAFMGVFRNSPTSKWYIVGGGKDRVFLYSVLPSSASEFTDFEPQFWLADSRKQEIFVLGRTLSTSAFAVLQGFSNAGVWTWSSQTLGTANTCQGCLGVYDSFSLTGDLYALVSNPSRGNRPSFWKREGATGLWTYKTLTNSPSLPEDVTVVPAAADSFKFVYSGSGKPGYGAASPDAIAFLVGDFSRSYRPTMFKIVRSTSSYYGVRLGDTGPDITLAAAGPSSALTFYGGIYHYRANSMLWVSRSASTTVLFAAHSSGAWSGIVLSSSPGAFAITAKSGSHLTADNHLDSYAPAGPSYTAYLNSADGIATLLLTGTQTGFSAASFSNHDVISGDDLCFSSYTTSSMVAKIGAYRGGEPSILIGSWVRDASVSSSTVTGNISSGSNAVLNVSNISLLAVGQAVSGTGIPVGTSVSTIGASSFTLSKNATSTVTGVTLTLTSIAETASVQGAGFGLNPGLGGALLWEEPGTVVKNLGHVWAGLNRGGYFWIADARKRNRLTEYRPNSGVRGHVTLAGIGTTTDFDWAYNGDQTTIGIVFSDNSNVGRLGFLLYDVVSGTVVSYEKAGFAPLNPVGVAPCASTPRIAYNPVTDTWDITTQDNSRLGGQLAFYRRSTTSASWLLEMVGSDQGNLGSMGAQNGRNPSKAVIAANGDIVIATESTAAANLLIVWRQANASVWASYSLATGGFARPEIVKSSNKYWVLGNFDGTSAKVAYSSTYTSGWVTFSTTPIQSSYNRVTALVAYPYSDGVAVASPLGAVGLVPASQEFGVFRFYENGNSVASVVAAKGRLQSAWYSGEEETSYSKFSFSPDGKLLYRANRPGRSDVHWGIRISRSEWAYLGDSALGSGRLTTIGDRTYREIFSDSTSQPLIYETGNNEAVVAEWSSLPLAERDSGQFLTLRYPYSADSIAAPLFEKGNPNTGLSADLGLQSGMLGAVDTRPWPLIGGSTRIQGGPGAGVLYHGSLALVAAPPSMTSLAYFGSSVVGSSGMFKLEAKNVLTIKGSWQISAPNDALRSYTITGPAVFDLDSSAFGHLVLQFPSAGALLLDAAANPLTYWSSLNHPTTSYALVLGELRESYFALYPCIKGESRLVKLTLGALEPRELTEDIQNIAYCAIPTQYSITKLVGQTFQVNPVGIDSVTIKRVGTAEGLQRLDFPALAGPLQLLAVQGLPPNNSGYYLYRSETDRGRAGLGGLRIEHIVGRYGNLVVTY